MEGLEMSGIAMHDWFPKNKKKLLKKYNPKKGGGIWMDKPSKLDNVPPLPAKALD